MYKKNHKYAHQLPLHLSMQNVIFANVWAQDLGVYLTYFVLARKLRIKLKNDIHAYSWLIPHFWREKEHANVVKSNMTHGPIRPQTFEYAIWVM